MILQEQMVLSEKVITHIHINQRKTNVKIPAEKKSFTIMIREKRIALPHKD
jgi:hypothetical protein